MACGRAPAMVLRCRVLQLTYGPSRVRASDARAHVRGDACSSPPLESRKLRIATFWNAPPSFVKAESGEPCVAPPKRRIRTGTPFASSSSHELRSSSVDRSSGRRRHGGRCDPTKVVRVALENAVSVASVLLLTEATLTEIPEPKTEHALPLE